MKVRCRRNSGIEPIDGTGLFFSRRTVFPVTPDTEYVVLAIGVFNSGLLYLIADDDVMPAWLPSEIFTLTEFSASPDWEVWAADRNVGPSEWLVLIGYPEVVHPGTHMDGLAELDPDALAIFRKQLVRSATQERARR